MNMQKVILITGASSGMGYETARILAEQGHRVYGAARRVASISPVLPFVVVRGHVTVPVAEPSSWSSCIRSFPLAGGMK